MVVVGNTACKRSFKQKAKKLCHIVDTIHRVAFEMQLCDPGLLGHKIEICSVIGGVQCNKLAGM